MTAAPTPDRIMDTALGFQASKTLLSAVKMGLFTELAASGPRSAGELQDELDLHERGARDFLDALVALGFLEREDGRYRNAPDADAFLDADKPTYIGGLLEMANDRLYPYWDDLIESLRTGEPQNEMKDTDGDFDVLYQDEEKLEGFVRAMTGASLPLGRRVAELFPWDRHDTVVDVGTAQGALPVELLNEHDHLQGIGFDLPAVRPHFEDYVASHGLEDRLRFEGGDFFEDPLPGADVVVMGHILHDWNLEEKKTLVRKAYEALPEGGTYVVYGTLIDEQRRENASGLLMSLNMLVETQGGFDYTFSECEEWLTEAGFEEPRLEPLTDMHSMVTARK